MKFGLGVTTIKKTGLLITIILFLSVVAYGNEFNDRAEAIIFNDSHIATSFEAELIEKGIPYEKKHNQFWYPSKYRSEVDSISENIFSNHRPINSYFVYDDEMFIEAKVALENANIKFRIIESDKGRGFSWNSEDKIKALEIVNGITRAPFEPL